MSIPSRETFTYQELHLRYLMSSTAEQPDNSGRTSTFNMWLTILIAALAAAILSWKYRQQAPQVSRQVVWGRTGLLVVFES